MEDYGIIMVQPAFITPAENRKNTQVVIDDWMLGPEDPSNEPGANRNEWDEGAGFRGFCHKFRFICHDMRSCQAWEEKPFETEGD